MFDFKGQCICMEEHELEEEPSPFKYLRMYKYKYFTMKNSGTKITMVYADGVSYHYFNNEFERFYKDVP